MTLSAKLAVSLCLALGSSFLTAAEMTLEIIPLQFRNADEIIPIIRPLVQHGGTVTGMNNQLIIKTTAGNLMEIKQILAKIDKAARRLLITVKQDISGDINTREHGVSGRYSRGDVTVSSNNRPDNNRGWYYQHMTRMGIIFAIEI